MTKQEFNTKFEELVSTVYKLDGNNDYKAEQELNIIIDYFINDINREFGVNFEIVHMSPNEMIRAGANTFMKSNIKKQICYSSALISKMKQKIKQTRTDSYDAKYNDVTYSLYLLNAISHEFTHCRQLQDIESGKLNYNTYLNSLCFMLSDFRKIPYLERTFEGEAYATGFSKILQYYSEGYFNNDYYKSCISSQLNSFNFFSKQYYYAVVVSNLSLVPLITDYDMFSTIPKYANNFISTLSQNERELVFLKYPQIKIGLKNNGKLKNCYELMEQYFYKHDDLNDLSLDKNNLDFLLDIYVFLLLPQLTPDIYNYLCIRYGNDKMDIFMNKLKNIVEKRKKIYSDSIEQGIKGFKLLEKMGSNLLLSKGITLDYLKRKGSVAINYMNDYLKKINDCLDNKVHKNTY